MLQKETDLCGVAALDMLSGYYRRGLGDVRRRALVEEGRSSGGVLAATLKSVLEDAGYAVSVFKGTLDDDITGLFHHLDRGRPLLVMLANGGYSHYEIVAGYDEGKKTLAILDPARGKTIVPIDRFQPAWERANRFTLLAVPSAQRAPNVAIQETQNP